eukprot:7902790-Alexandrium_andersonii.AAC.1
MCLVPLSALRRPLPCTPRTPGKAGPPHSPILVAVTPGAVDPSAHGRKQPRPHTASALTVRGVPKSMRMRLRSWQA